MLSVLAYAPFWTFIGPLFKRRHPREFTIRLFPMIASLSLVSFGLVYALAGEDIISRLGEVSFWSIALFISMIIFPAFSFVSVATLWRTPKQNLRRGTFIYSVVVSVALVIIVFYLAYSGMIGLRTWA